MKKARAKAASARSTKKSDPRAKKIIGPAEMRQNITSMVGAEVNKITRAVVDEAKKGQLATVKYLFEVAGVFPPAEGTEPMPERETLAKKLLVHLAFRWNPW
jgi:hypothetical protein